MAVARHLGPAAKGAVASIALVTAIGASIARAGIGDAFVALVARRGAAVDATSRAAAGVLLVTIPIAGVVGGLTVLVLPQARGIAHPAALVAVATIAAAAAMSVLASMLDWRRDFVWPAAARAVVSAVTALATVGLVVVGPGRVVAALAAALIGTTAGLLLLLGRAAATGVHLRPRLDRPLMRAGLHLGVAFEASYLLILLSERVDLLVVHALVGSAAAGQYSVALTMGGLASFAPYALTAAAYPQLASLAPDDVGARVARLTRFSIASTLLVGVAMAAAVPVAVPVLFGEGFRDAVAPSLVLLIGALLSSPQWTLCRARAARSGPRLLITSYAVALAVMLAADAVLVPALGVVGAALGSVIGGAAGFAVALGQTSREYPQIPFSSYVPRPADAREFVTVLQSLAAGTRGA